MPLRANLYVDGYNLYYSALKGTEYKWLDLAALGRRLLGPTYELKKIRYFTAPVKQKGTAERQELYLRAIRTLPAMNIHKGTFHNDIVIQRPLVTPIPGHSKFQRVWDREEKGSDVNLASFLLLDAFDKNYDTALIISNDSDLRTPVTLVKRRFHKEVVVAVPSQKARLVLPASRWLRISKDDLSASQLPTPMKDSQGREITKPEKWSKP